jgi:hypothetical protein
MGMFREKLNELVEKKAELPDEEVAKRVDELKEMTVDLPDEEEKAKLDRFLEDFKSVKEQDDATAKEAASMVADLFEKLDTAAMKDAPDAGGETTETVEETETEAPLTESAAPEATEEAKETVEETVAPEGEADDADPGANAEYTLEEIYQFCKKRRAEEEAAEATDGCATDGAEEVEEEEEDEEKEVVTDNAPRIPVTMNGTTAAQGSLADMFNKIKGGR